MSDPYVVDSRPASSFWRFSVSWPAIFLGAVVAVATGAMLNLLGVALGAAAINPWSLSGDDAEEFTAAAGAWMVLANAVALFVGAAIATRASRRGDDARGGLHGLSIWAVSFLLALVLSGASLAGSVASVMGGQAERLPTDETLLIELATRERSGGLPVVDVQDRAEADDLADTAAVVALWAFLTMLVGAVAAVAGGVYGSRPHRWIDRFDRRLDAGKAPTPVV